MTRTETVFEFLCLTVRTGQEEEEEEETVKKKKRRRRRNSD